MHVRMTVTGDCGHVLGVFTDKIEDKYPFYCEECEDDKRTGRYPWTITAEVVEDGEHDPAALPAPGLATDVETLSAEMTDVLERLDMLEDARKTERAMTWFALSQFAEAHPDDEFTRRLRAGEFDHPRPAAAEPEPAACAGCGHAGLSHWELSEPDGERKGCGILGCPCIVYAE